MKKISKIIIVLTMVVAIVALTCISSSAVFMCYTHDDRDKDSLCDNCGVTVEHECIDSDSDYTCDFCNFTLPHEHIDSDFDSFCDYCIYRFHKFEFTNHINFEKAVIYLGDIQNELSHIPNATSWSLFQPISLLDAYLTFSEEENHLENLRFIEFSVIYMDENNDYTVVSDNCIFDYNSMPQTSIVYHNGLRLYKNPNNELRFAFQPHFTNSYSYTNNNSNLGEIGQYALIATLYFNPYSPYISEDEIIANKNLLEENNSLKEANQALESTNQGLIEQNNSLSNSFHQLESEKQILIDEKNTLKQTNQGLIEQNNSLNESNRVLQEQKNHCDSVHSDYNEILKQRDDAREGLSNSSAVLNFFQGIYEAVNGVLHTFFDLDVFGFNVGSIVAIFVIALIVIFVIKLFI